MMRDLLNAHVTEEWKALRGGYEQAQKTAGASQLLWLLPSLLLRLPAVGAQGSSDLLDPPPEASPGAKAIAFSQLVRNRLCELEAGGLSSALHRYMQEANDLEDRDSRRAALTAAALPLQPNDDEDTLRKAAAKLGSGAIKAAKALLTRTVRTPLTEGNCQQNRCSSRSAH